ncbi:hypothetical protein NQD34_012309 [Periophthalmus magnuspinnatus]|nr:hypothetical protein NQD34_012309 [Periophthalmus magnuspinnatus]
MPLKRKSYPADYKLQVVEYAAKNGNRAAERKFRVNEKLVRNWRKAEVNLISMKKTKKANRGLKARWPELEEQLHKWVLEQRTAGTGFSTAQLGVQAQVIAKEMNINGFTGGRSWCTRFMQRNSLSIRPRTTMYKMSQKVSTEFQDKLHTFHEFLEKQVTEHNVTPDHIINMGEVHLSFGIPIGWDVPETGQKSVNVETAGHEKLHFTVVLACCGDGSKLPPMVIFKRKKIPKIVSPSVVVAVHDKGWMDEEMLNFWLTECYTKRPDGFFRIDKALLLMDSLQANITSQLKDQLEVFNSIPCIIPGGLTKVLQPLDISVNRSFKAVLHHLWEQWMVDGEHSFTATGKMRHPTFLQVTEWIDKAWTSVTTETILLGFRMAGIIGTDAGFYDSHAEAGFHLPPELAGFFRSDIEDEEFNGFSDLDLEVSMEVEGWDSSLEEELGISLVELKQWIDEAVEKSEMVQKKKAELQELQEWVEKKEQENAVAESLLKDANQSLLECEKLVKQTYEQNGLVYVESSSEEEGFGRRATIL